MTPERWKKLDLLFHEALELQGEARAFHLAKVCGEDEQLRQEAERLIAAHEREGSFIDSPIFAELDGPTNEVCNESPVGRRIGPYQVISQLGQGGMAKVFLAEDTRLERKVALKVLPSAFTQNPGRVRRFEREAKAVSALNHPNILTIHEIGEADGAHYIVSEFVEGETLREQMRRGALSLATSLDVARQVTDALAAAHAAGIVHRDIKPENVMARPDGLVKVLDFGLAKLTEQPAVTAAAVTAEDDSHIKTTAGLSTEPGVVMGTVSYMSPEQARGQKVDHRTDIFSLGVMVYEMLAGRRPFEGETTSDVMAAILTKEPEPLEELSSEAGTKLARAVIRCLAKDREARFQTVNDLATQLQSATERSEQSALRQARRWPRPVWVAVTLALLIIAAVVYWKLAPKATPDSQIKSLVVLPLENLSGDPAQEYLADGMTDALIGDLAKIGALRVISRTSAMRYKGAKKPLLEIASELNVDAVVEGTVQRSGNRVSIRARLIHAGADRQLWAESYDRDLRDALGLQSEVARAIAREVRAKLTPAEQTRLANYAAVNRKALEDYLQGRYLYWRMGGQLEKAVEYFQSAINEDPTYAPAYAGMAACYNALGSVVVGALPPPEARRRAEEAALKALQLDDTLAEAHAALGYAYNYNWNWAAAEQEIKRAIELNPNSAETHSLYSRHLSAVGRADEAIAEANLSQDLDPLSLYMSTMRGHVLTNARHYDEAIEQLRRVIALDPNDYMAHWFLGIVYSNNRMFDEAVATSERAVVLSRRAPGALGVLGMNYGLAGRKVDANKTLNELLELNRRRYVTPVALVQVYIGLGDKDRAFDWLEKVYQERSNFMAFLKVIPMADPLRSDPRFDDLLRRIGLPR
ncbi:MAG TPA: protein kinase [Blastocatellia bacterium]|nr:protein kinase [Blastocatellia bacterium]